MLIPIGWPPANNRLIFKVYDYEGIGKDEIVGSLIFNIKEIASV